MKWWPRSARRVWPEEEPGEIMLQKVGDEVRVIEAPEFARIDLAMLQVSDPEFLVVDREVITVAGEVEYLIIRWEPSGLVVRLLEDRRQSRHTGP